LFPTSAAGDRIWNPGWKMSPANEFLPYLTWALGQRERMLV
jgi:hypothetical protein